jgi:hypothetical protein
MNMKTLLPIPVFLVMLATMAQGQELAKVKVATVRINAITGSGNFYDRVRLLSCDKDTLAAIKKINAELKDVQKQVIDTEDEVKLAELGRRTQFLNQKLNLLRQHAMNVRQNFDLQAIIRKFVVDNYKDKYNFILNQDSGIPDRFFLWKGNVQTDDITDEVSEKFMDNLEQSLGD